MPTPGTTFVVRAPRATTGSDVRNVRSKIQLANSKVLMLELDPAVPATWPTVTRSLYNGWDEDLEGQTTSCFGRGDTAYSPNGGTTGMGPWKQLNRMVTDTDGTNLFFVADSNGMNIVAANDMGGPCFSGANLVGVIESVTTVCDPTCRNHTATIASTRPGLFDFQFLKADTASMSPMLLERNGVYTPTTALSYRTWDNSNWCFRDYYGTFAHAPGCNWLGNTSTGLARTDAYLSYKGWDNVDWAAVHSSKGGFIHWPASDESDQHADHLINYKSWSGTNWGARMAFRLKNTPSSGSPVSYSNFARYRTWDNSSWCVSIHGSKFVHAQNCDWSAHASDIIRYKGWDNVQWEATFDGTNFTHKRTNPVEVRVSNIMNYKAPDNTDWTAERYY